MYNKTSKPVKRRGAYMRILMSLVALAVMAVAIVIAADSNTQSYITQPENYTGGGAHRIIYTIRAI